MARRDPSEAWRGDHPWAVVYDRIARSGTLGRLVWRVGMGSDLGDLHRVAAAELARLDDAAAVLDVPCGGGVALQDVPAGRSLRYVAGDISPAMLERTGREAARLGVAVELREVDVHALAFDDAAFDLVLAFTSLHCFPDPERAVHELARVLRPGGRLALSTMLTGEGLRHAAGWVGGRAMGVLGPGCTRDELVRWLAEAGLGEVDVRRAGGITYVTATRT